MVYVIQALVYINQSLVYVIQGLVYSLSLTKVTFVVGAVLFLLEHGSSGQTKRSDNPSLAYSNSFPKNFYAVENQILCCWCCAAIGLRFSDNVRENTTFLIKYVPKGENLGSFALCIRQKRLYLHATNLSSPFERPRITPFYYQP